MKLDENGDYMNNTINQIRFLDETAYKDTSIHKLNPITKVLVTFLYIVVVISYGKYDIERILPLFLYPILIFILSDLRAKPILRISLLALPFTLGIGIFNPILDKRVAANLFGILITYGWISFIMIIIKTLLTIIATFILIATTGIDKITKALIMLKVPKIFAVQILLTYRYIFVLTEEVLNTINAYTLRAPDKKGINIAFAGSLLGQIILRSFKRAQNIYNAMLLRGFNGEFCFQNNIEFRINDYKFIIFWSIFIIASRLFNIPKFLGLVLTGVIK
ncbi:Nickel transport protein NikQ [Caloramator mitchellensis]|uniref:Nickel transport protein NikQ n=1 Tax=Caloramator mitchellensis TaxID=908809 RepID=A0A0R3JWC1_CALMK|nr:energy-coupling factor transporter transmembrane component T [Caloramator mitchellensis]KRQ87851.1 Nickel transport protein NikQ [Caloramator mitchellensis]